jgi:hypothetical protein
MELHQVVLLMENRHLPQATTLLEIIPKETGTTRKQQYFQDHQGKQELWNK